MAKLALRVNGSAREVDSPDPEVPLLYVLRNDLALTGTSEEFYGKPLLVWVSRATG